MRLGHVSVDFRNLLWRAVAAAISRERGLYDSYVDGAFLREVIIDYYMDIRHQPHDSMPHRPGNHRTLLREIVLQKPYHEVLTLVEFFLRHGYCPHPLKHDLLASLERVGVAYTVQSMDGIPTIVPRSSAESGAATQQAIETVEDKGPAGAKAHLRSATEAINEQRYADALRESIHAVESVARTIDPASASTLGPALKSLEKAGVLQHPALTKAFGKAIRLYE